MSLYTATCLDFIGRAAVNAVAWGWQTVCLPWRAPALPPLPPSGQHLTTARAARIAARSRCTPAAAHPPPALLPCLPCMLPDGSDAKATV